MALRHVVLIKLNELATPARVAELRAALLKLPTVIDGITSYTVGTNAGIPEGNPTADVGVVADFVSEDAFKAYQLHEAHQAVVREHIKPLLAGRTAIQFHLDQ